MRGNEEMTVRVDRTTLIETLRENRDAHRDMFLAAQDRYRAKWIELLDQRLAEARTGGAISRVFALPEPEDYTDAYTTAIEMVEWHTEPTLEISREDFRRYVLNQWEWGQRFTANTASYLVG